MAARAKDVNDSTQQSEAGRIAPATIMSATILAIDDEQEMREAIVAALESTEYEVVTAGDGEEGLALVKPFEWLLREGEPMVDVSAQEQYRDALPIVRRVQIEGHHIVATYDPMVIHGGEPREIVLEDFAGHAGLTLTLPADDQVRVFVLREG